MSVDAGRERNTNLKVALSQCSMYIFVYLMWLSFHCDYVIYLFLLMFVCVCVCARMHLCVCVCVREREREKHFRMAIVYGLSVVAMLPCCNMLWNELWFGCVSVTACKCGILLCSKVNLILCCVLITVEVVLLSCTVKWTLVLLCVG